MARKKKGPGTEGGGSSDDAGDLPNIEERNADVIDIAEARKKRESDPRVSKKKLLQKDQDELEAAIDRMNARFFIFRRGGKTQVGELVTKRFGDFDNEVIEAMQKAAFIDFYAGEKVPIEYTHGGREVKMASVGEVWFHHERARRYEELIVAPWEPEVIGNKMNLWKWGTQPAEGDWGMIMDHIVMMANGSRELAEYVVRRFAWNVQNPLRAAEVANVLVGQKGCGKGMFAKISRAIFGARHFGSASRDQFVGKHVGHLEHAASLTIDEALWPGNKSDEEVLKHLITSDTLSIENKYESVRVVTNMTKIDILSNNDWAAPAGERERRYCVLRSLSDRIGDVSYFKELDACIRGAGSAAFFHHLLSIDLDGWHPRDDVPRTGELFAQQKAGFTRTNWFPGWWREVLLDGVIPGHDPDDPSFAFSTRHVNFWSFEIPEGIDRNGMRPGIMERVQEWADISALNHHVIGGFLSSIAKARPRARSSSKTGRKWGWRFKSLKECRRDFIDGYPGFEDELEEGWRDEQWSTDVVGSRGTETS